MHENHVFNLPNSSETWQVSTEHCCWTACQFSRLYEWILNSSNNDKSDLLPALIFAKKSYCRSCKVLQPCDWCLKSFCYITLKFGRHPSSSAVKFQSDDKPQNNLHKLQTEEEKIIHKNIESVSADGRSARPARLDVHPIWWRWHGNTKSLSKVNQVTSSVCLRHN